MGNTINRDKIRFVKETKPINYLFEIRKPKFDKYTIIEIRHELQLLLKTKNNGLEYYIDNIIDVLNHIELTEHTNILEQTDGYLFNRLNGSMPFVAIINTGAEAKRRENNVSSDGFYYKYNL